MTTLQSILSNKAVEEFPSKRKSIATKGDNFENFRKIG